MDDIGRRSGCDDDKGQSSLLRSLDVIPVGVSAYQCQQAGRRATRFRWPDQNSVREGRSGSGWFDKRRKA